MSYFEKQDVGSRICVLCALNNCLQSKLATAQELDTIATRLAVVEAASQKKKHHTVADYYHLLSKSGLEGGWSIRIVRKFLENHHIAFEWDISIINPKKEFLSGRYFIRTRIGKAKHAIAIVDGMLLDSLKDHPVPWTGDPSYTILLVCRILE